MADKTINKEIIKEIKNYRIKIQLMPIKRKNCNFTFDKAIPGEFNRTYFLLFISALLTNLLLHNISIKRAQAKKMKVTHSK